MYCKCMEKPFRCKLGIHSFEGKGKIKYCKFCEISNHQAFWSDKNAGNWRNSDGGFGDAGGE